MKMQVALTLLLAASPAALAVATGDGSNSCDVVELNFKDLANPMAKFYNQSETFQGGEYLYDQLSFPYGVIVSARVKQNSHRNGGNPFIPCFDADTKKWENCKAEMDPEDPTTGQAVRLFDTWRPHGVFPDASPHKNPACSDISENDGDPDLGAPNESCPQDVVDFPFPGKGAGGEPGNGNLYENCEPLGLVTIIQEKDKACPDDSWKGGYMTYTFNDPVELQELSFLDIDDGQDGQPVVALYYGDSAKVELQTKSTGENGLFRLDIAAADYPNVTMVDVRYEGSGSLNSLKYRYCRPPMPEPEILLKKYAGPPDSCDANGVLDNMEDDLYTLPSQGDEWVYCYVISIPESSDECLYGVTLTDSSQDDMADQIVTMGSTELCSSSPTVYIEGPVRLGTDAPDPQEDAKVTGTGKYSNTEVSSSDSAGVTIECEKEGLGSEYCPDSDGVSVAVKGADPSTNDADILWDITETDGGSIKFRVANPFPEKSVTAFVQYHAPTVTNGGGWTQNCTSDDTLSCGDDAIVYEADCMKGNGNPFTLIQVFFLHSSNTPNEEDVTIHKCCKPPSDYDHADVVQYSFLLRCACPTNHIRRRLLRVENEDVNDMNVEQMMALFEERDMQLQEQQDQAV